MTFNKGMWICVYRFKKMRFDVIVEALECGITSDQVMQEVRASSGGIPETAQADDYSVDCCHPFKGRPSSSFEQIRTFDLPMKLWIAEPTES